MADRRAERFPFSRRVYQLRLPVWVLPVDCVDLPAALVRRAADLLRIVWGEINLLRCEREAEDVVLRQIDPLPSSVPIDIDRAALFTDCVDPERSIGRVVIPCVRWTCDGDLAIIFGKRRIGNEQRSDC